MSRRYSLPIIAVVGLVLSAQVQAQAISSHAGGQSSAYKGRAKPKENAPPAIPIAVQNDIHGIASELKTANQKQPSSAERDQTQRNLAAQEKMAAWVPWMFGVGMFETLLTLTGVFLVWRTLKASWEAARHAKRGADAAHATVASMEDTARRQLRAYIHFTIDKSAPVSFNAAQKTVIRILYENCGQTPAMRCTSGGELDILPWPAPVPFPDPIFEKEGAIYSLYPKAEGRWNTPISSRRIFSAEEIQEAINGKTKRLFLYGEIKYFDIFGKEHFTRFRMMSGVEPKANLLSFCREGNETDD